MKRKSLLIALLLSTILCFTLALAACTPSDGGDDLNNGEQDGQTTDEHTHTFDTEWIYDEDLHWHAATCEHADEVADKGEHTYENNVCTVCSYVYGSGGALQYELSDDGSYYTVSKSGYLLNVTSMTIPAYRDGIPIKALADYAFDEVTSLQSIVIPDTVTSIGHDALRMCYALTDVDLPESLTRISDYMFYGCGSLKNLTIPDGVTEIGDYAFTYCYSLADIDSHPASFSVVLTLKR